jgi:hypothetical protein
MKVVIDIPDNEEQFFANLMMELGYSSHVQSQAPMGVPYWHKEILDKRAQLDNQPTISLEELERRWAVE